MWAAMDDDDDDPFADLLTAASARRADVAARREAIKKKAMAIFDALEEEEEEDSETVEDLEAAVKALDEPAPEPPPEPEMELVELVAEEEVEDEEDIEEDIKELFEILDTDGSGEIELAEVKALLAKLNKPDDDATAAALLAEADADGDGQISLQEFMTAFKSSADLFGLSVMAAMEDIEDEDFDLADKSLETSVLFDNLFEMADADNSGGIDKEEFRTLYSLLSVVTGNIDDAEDDLTKVDKIFMSMDEDGNGQVELEELKLWLVDKVEDEWPELHAEVSTWG